MFKGKIFENGRSQAIRLPKECRMEGKEVNMNKIGDVLIISPVQTESEEWDSFWAALDYFSEDFDVRRPEWEGSKREDL